jgi:hypothetical protein
VTKPVEVK